MSEVAYVLGQHGHVRSHHVHLACCCHVQDEDSWNEVQAVSEWMRIIAHDVVVVLICVSLMMLSG